MLAALTMDMRERECSLCHTPDRYRNLEVANFRYWRVVLSENQYYLGRPEATHRGYRNH